MQIADINHKRSDIAWKPDCSLLAMGNEDGSVVLLIAKSFLTFIISALKKLKFSHLSIQTC
jgi:hypothetical protein